MPGNARSKGKHVIGKVYQKMLKIFTYKDVNPNVVLALLKIVKNFHEKTKRKNDIFYRI